MESIFLFQYQSKMAKELVKLRQRKMPSGNISLYLDISNKGNRVYEYLKLYIVDNPTSPEQKKQNKENLRLAQAVKAQRIVELQNNEFGFKNDRGNESFLAFFNELVNKKDTKTRKSYLAAYKILQTCCNESFRIKDIDAEFLDRFKWKLEKHETSYGKLLSNNTKWLYYSKIVVAINLLVKNEIIVSNPAKKVEKPKKAEVEKKYLTSEELQLLIDTPIRNVRVRNAFVFSCLTGLRWSDVESITWGMVVEEKTGGLRLHFKQEKTEGQEYLNLSPQVSKLLGPRRNGSDFVFKLPKYGNTINRTIRNWAKKAGIEKDITFHSARHSFAIMMIDLDVDLYVVSKLLGHKDVKTTQIYAKVRDKKKKEAISKIPDFSLS